jgi:hypothetical protein
VKPNYRGRPLGVWLGVAFVLALILSAMIVSLVPLIATGHLTAWGRRLLWIMVGVAAISTAGLYDDFQQKRTRGIVRQLAMLWKGRVSSGIVKLVVISSASALVVWMLGARGARWVAGAGVVAGAANLWNLLDVVPGRALKFFLPAAVVFALAAPGKYGTLAAIAVGAGALILVPDMLEVGMLGDAGSNVLGFIVGVGMLDALSTAGLVVALAAILAFHFLAETVTLSRIIQDVPPLRWFDRLGRVKHADEQPKQDRDEHSSSS